MIEFIKTSGPYGLLILILALINLALVIYRANQLRSDCSEDGPGFEQRLQSILFWGGICAILGLLGQASGIYNALHAIARATEISPQVVFEGLAQSFTTTLMGLGVLLLSGVAWLVLRTWHRRQSAIPMGT